jgi:hypothetical protein
MAKKKKADGKVSKSQAVRDQLAKQPTASANKIAAAASKQVGEEVTTGLVYNIKSTEGGTKKKAEKKGPAKKELAKKALAKTEPAKTEPVAKSASNKSQAIRDQLAKSPKATANEIAAAAGKQVGEEVSAALVYQVKASMDSKKKSAKKAAKQTAKPSAPAASGGGVDAKLIKEAAELLSHAGDPKAAREALAVAAEVSKVLRR